MLLFFGTISAPESCCPSLVPDTIAEEHEVFKFKLTDTQKMTHSQQHCSCDLSINDLKHPRNIEFSFFLSYYTESSDSKDAFQYALSKTSALCFTSHNLF